jgi:hypothetical protein
MVRIDELSDPNRLTPQSEEQLEQENQNFVESLEELRRLGDIYVDSSTSLAERSKRMRWWVGVSKIYLAIEVTVEEEILRRENELLYESQIDSDTSDRGGDVPERSDTEDTDNGSISDISTDNLDQESHGYL